MKRNLTIPLLAVCGTVAFSAGCGKSDTPVRPAAMDTAAPVRTVEAQTNKPAQSATAVDAVKAAEPLKPEAIQPQAGAERPAPEKAAVDKTAAEKLAQAAAEAAREAGRIQSLIDTAKNLTGENKYAEALKIIGELSTLKLTPAQQAVVDGLKTAAEKQVAQAVSDKAAAAAAKGIGDVLGGKK